MNSTIKEAIAESIRVKTRMAGDEEIIKQIEAVSGIISGCLKSGHRVLFCGNGGSAADAQHLAAELSGRFYMERRALNAEAININIPFLTAVSNDYDFGYSYARYLEGAARKGDVLVLLSTSGNSENINRAAAYCAENGIFTIALTGNTGGKLAGKASMTIRIPSDDTPRIQEAHMLIGHCICQIVEKQMVDHGQ
jgi:D-sedoheptulose 7-phosphate isomerase